VSHAQGLQPSDEVTLDVRRGDPTPEELAALIAVVTEAYEKEAAAAIADDTSKRSAWSLSQRTFRGTLDRDRGWSA
jgi:hypothetical protein